MKNLGDLAEMVATRLTTDTSAPVAEAATLTEEAALLADNSLFTKIRFSWKPEDRVILDRIRIAAEAMTEDAFAEQIDVVDDFFLQLRVPEQRDGIVVRGADGRPVWQTDDAGNPIERWSQLTGQDIEHTLANLERLRFSVAPRVNELFLEALYARHVASDVHDEAWGKVMDGTQGDKSARSNRASQVDHYASYFRFYLYSTAKTLLDEIDRFTKVLTDVRYWQVRTQR